MSDLPTTPLAAEDATWSVVGAAQTRAYTSDELVMTGTASGGTTPNATLLVRTAPSTPWTITCKCQSQIATPFCFAGVHARASSSGKFWGPNIQTNSSTDVNETHVALQRYTSPTSRASTAGEFTGGLVVRNGVWLRITYDGTTLSSYWSLDGKMWWGLISEAKTVHFSTDTIDGVGIWADPFSTTAPVSAFGVFVVS